MTQIDPMHEAVYRQAQEFVSKELGTIDPRDDIALVVACRAMLAERKRCRAGIDEAIRTGMTVIADELNDPSAETVEMVARAICREEYGSEDAGWENQIPAARAAITAVRGAFFQSNTDAS